MRDVAISCAAASRARPFRLWRLTFFAAAKKDKQRKQSRWIQPAHGTRGAVVIAGLAILARSGNGRHPCRPPSGCPRRTASDFVTRQGQGEARAQAKPKRKPKPSFGPTLTFPLSPATTAIRRPGGRRPWRAAGFGPRQEAESETHRSTSFALSGVDLTRRCFLLVTFPCTSKEK